MTTYHELLNDILVLNKAGLKSIIRIRHFFEIMRNENFVPLEHYPGNYIEVTWQCRLLSTEKGAFKPLALRKKPLWETKGRFMFTPSARGRKVYGELSQGIEKFILAMEVKGMRTLSDAAAFLLISNGKNTIRNLHAYGKELGLWNEIGTLARTIHMGMGKDLTGSLAFKGHNIYSQKNYHGPVSSDVELTAAGRRLLKKATGG